MAQNWLIGALVIVTSCVGMFVGYMTGLEGRRESKKPDIGTWVKSETVDECGRKKFAWQCSKCCGIGWPNMRYCPHCKQEKKIYTVYVERNRRKA